MEGAAKRPRRDNTAEYVAVFEKAEPLTDVVFEVEGRKLHFWKVLLRMTSPVSSQMFASDAKDKKSTVIPLPGQKLKDVDLFFQNIHPAYAWKQVQDDGMLYSLLRLADEYQTEHIRQKCLHYMEQQMETLGKYSSVSECNLDETSKKRALMYFYLCEKFKVTKPRQKLLELISSIPVKDLECNPAFKPLSEANRNDILKERCRALEKTFLDPK